MKYQLATVIVTAGFANHMRMMGRYLDRGDMNGLFVTPLSASGNAPATHYISSGMFPKPFLVAMRKPVIMFTRVKAAFEKRGEVMPITQLQVTSRINACTVVIAGDVTPGVPADPVVEGSSLPETPHQTLTRVGLSIVTAPLA